jgi:hypothetical protein
MADDARISTALPFHPKTRKLRKRLGTAGCWSLVCLLLWTASNRWDGNLSGLSDEDIELAAEWDGDPGGLVHALCEVGFLEGSEVNYIVHDWAEHNPWAAGRGERIESARRAAFKRWGNHSDAKGMQDAYEEDADRMREDENRNAPNPTQPNQSISSKTEGSDGPEYGVVVTIHSVDLDRALDGVWTYYLDKIGRNPKTYEFTPMRKRKGLARLKDCLKKTAGDVNRAVELMKVCVDSLVASDWHMGRDPKGNGKRFCGWEKHLFKSYEQMEGWWNE